MRPACILRSRVHLDVDADRHPGGGRALMSSIRYPLSDVSGKLMAWGSVDCARGRQACADDPPC